jgi:hypothetical protein
LTLMLALFGAVGTVDAQSDSGMPLPGTIMNVQRLQSWNRRCIRLTSRRLRWTSAATTAAICL